MFHFCYCSILFHRSITSTYLISLLFFIFIHANDQSFLRHCPTASGYCCEIIDPERKFVFMLSRHSLLPNQSLPHYDNLPKPYGYEAKFNPIDTAESAVSDADMTKDLDSFTLSELPFLSTIHDDPVSPHIQSNKNHDDNPESTTPNAYQILSSLNSLPNQEKNKQKCMDCLREKNGADCNTCRAVCPRFCEKLCQIEVKKKVVRKALVVKGPRFKKDPERLIPRIIHQVSLDILASRSGAIRS